MKKVVQKGAKLDNKNNKRLYNLKGNLHSAHLIKLQIFILMTLILKLIALTLIDRINFQKERLIKKMITNFLFLHLL